MMSCYFEFQVEVHNKYSAADFYEGLRQLFRHAGWKDDNSCSC